MFELASRIVASLRAMSQFYVRAAGLAFCVLCGTLAAAAVLRSELSDTAFEMVRIMAVVCAGLVSATAVIVVLGFPSPEPQFDNRLREETLLKGQQLLTWQLFNVIQYEERQQRLVDTAHSRAVLAKKLKRRTSMLRGYSEGSDENGSAASTVVELPVGGIPDEVVESPEEQWIRVNPTSNLLIHRVSGRIQVMRQ